MDRWYVLYTKPRGEFKVRQALEARDVCVFLPTVLNRRLGKPPQWEPFFPRYLFACCDLEVVRPDILRWTPGLVRMLAFDGVPATMPAEAVELIRVRVEELNGRGGLPPHEFRRGERVRIKSGPLQGLEAIFDGPLSPSERVRVLVDFLSEANRVELSVRDLEPVNELAVRRGRRTRGRGRRIKVRGERAGENEAS